MSESKYPRIAFSERLSTGIVVHFENAVSVFFSAAFLYEQRDAESNEVLDWNADGDDPQPGGDGPGDGGARRRGEAVGDVPSWSPAETPRVATRIEVATRKTKNTKTKPPNILVVDDDERVRTSLGKVLQFNKFDITTAANAKEALRLIHTKSFDVLLSGMRMTESDEGFTVVNAMHNSNPDAVTLVYTGYSELGQALDAILLPANEVSVKPMAIPTLVSLIHEKLAKRGTSTVTNIERVAAILERDSSATISDWLLRVERENELTCVPLSKEQRTGHLPKLLEELVHRLRVPRKLGTKAVSEAAVQHGKVRHSQGYSVPMIIEESRILQVSIFETLQNSQKTINFSLLLMDVMAIADEVDSQLKQTIISFTGQAASA